ncbi:MAG: hypothetical protein NT056_07840 [Proteobacteria bacterium]|nr:hypothetical protein [Pseudomonadota bacterium]
MKLKSILSAVIAFIFLALGPALAQQGATKEESEKGKIGKYERKSISYFKTYYQVPMDQRHQEVTEKGIRGAVELGRFDYNAIPIEVENINDLAQLIAKYVDQVKLDRAKAQGREDYRFKEKLVTGADLERIINSAYIYTPTVTKFKMERTSKTVHDSITGQNTTKNYWNATVGADVTFYHVTPQYVNGQIDSVQLTVLKTISQESTQDKEIIPILSPEDKAKWGAFDSAVNNPFLGLARQIQVELRKITEFQLSAQVQSSGWNSVEFEFGKQSDVELDAGYKVYEEVAGKGKTYIGYAKVRRVGDEKGQPPVSSRAQKIISKEKIEAGTELKEYPQLLVDGYIRFGLLPIDQSNLNADAGSMAFGPVGGLELDLARFIAVSELWFSAEGYIAMASDAYFYGVEGGLVKKFYLRRLALDLGVRGGWSRVTLSGGANDGYMQDQFGVTPYGGLELLLAPWLSVTGQVGFRLYTGGKEWEKEGITDDDGPEVTTTGPAITFGINGMF